MNSFRFYPISSGDLCGRVRYLHDEKGDPTELLDIEVWRGREAFAHLLEDMPDTFYSKDLSARYSLFGRELYGTLKLLLTLGFISRGEKGGAGYEYRKNSI